MTYPEALQYLESLDRYGIRPGLERIARLCELAGHPERAFPSVLVAGTNGKGSTCAFLAAILQAAGYRVGSSPKPHLYSPRERLQVDGALCPEERFAALAREVRPLIEEDASNLGPVTYFEAMTLIAFLWFARRQIDWGVIEVGLGGRLDATNVLEPRASVITNIGLDHTDRLGATVEEIAVEKAGILRRGVPALSGATGPALDVIRDRAAATGAPLWRLEVGVCASPGSARGEAEVLAAVRDAGERGSVFDLHLPTGSWEELSISMPGEHQVANAALAAATAAWLSLAGPAIPEAAIRQGLRAARVPGRLEVISERPLLLLDAAHNPDGARALAAALQRIYLAAEPAGRLVLVLALSEAHAPAESAAILAPLADMLIATASRHPQAVPVERVAALARHHLAAGAGLATVPDVAGAVAAARRYARPEDVVCVAGSIYALGEVPRPESADG